MRQARRSSSCRFGFTTARAGGQGFERPGDGPARPHRSPPPRSAHGESVPQSTQTIRSWLCAKGLHGRDIRAIAFVNPVGNIEGGLTPHGAQPDDQQGRRGAAVDVVIGKDRNALPAYSRACRNRAAAGSMSRSAQRVGQKIAQGGVQEGVRLDPAQRRARPASGTAPAAGGSPAPSPRPDVRLKPRADPAAAGQRGWSTFRKARAVMGLLWRQVGWLVGPMRMRPAQA